MFQVGSTVICRNMFEPWHYSILETWSVFKKQVLHFVHLNIDSLQSNKEELRQIAKDTNSVVVGLSEKKI